MTENKKQWFMMTRTNYSVLKEDEQTDRFSDSRLSDYRHCFAMRDHLNFQPNQTYNTFPRAVNGSVNISSPPLIEENSLQHDLPTSTETGSSSREVSRPRHFGKVNRHLQFHTTGDSADSDVVHVDVCGYQASSNANQTVAALQMCKELVVYPFNVFLMFIGWRPLTHLHLDHPSCLTRCGNILYVIALWSILLFSYIYQVIACAWKLCLYNCDGGQTSSPGQFTPSYTPIIFANVTSQRSASVTPEPTTSEFIPTSSPAPGKSLPACDHLISTYIVPHCFHFIAYLVGFYHWRIRDSETLYGLMEKVFHYCSTDRKQKDQYRVITRLRIYIFLGVLWLLIALATQILCDIAFATTGLSILTLASAASPAGMAINYSLFLIDIIGYIAGCVVSMVIVFNYAMNCDLIVFYIDSVCSKLQMRSLPLKIACSDMLNIKNSISHLNGEIGIMACLMILIYAEMTFLGVAVLIKNPSKSALIWVYRSFYIICHIPGVLCPILQAAHVNKKTNKFLKYALDMRTFGYLNESPSDLDSFLLFCMANKLSVKLFKFPIRSSHLIVILVASIFVIIILSQLGYLGSSNLML